MRFCATTVTIVVFCSVFFTGCKRGLPNDEEIKQKWNQEKGKLLQLATVMEKTSYIHAISGSGIETNSGDSDKLTEDRRREYVGLLPKGCSTVYREINEQENFDIRFVYARSGTTLGQREKGLVYRIGKKPKTYDSLMFFKEPQPEGAFYRHLEGEWYMYLLHDR